MPEVIPDTPEVVRGGEGSPVERVSGIPDCVPEMPAAATEESEVRQLPAHYESRMICWQTAVPHFGQTAVAP